MANVTQTLACTGSALVDYYSQDTNAHGAASYDVLRTVSRDRQLLLSFAALSSSYLYKKLVSAQLRIYYSTSQSGAYVVAEPLDEAFTPASVTWATKPGTWKIWDGLEDAPKSGTSLLLPAAVDSDAATASQQARYALTSGCFALQADAGGFGESTPDSATFIVYTEAAASGKRPVLTVVVDDATTITSKVTGQDKTSGYVNPHTAQTFAWNFVASGSYRCAGNWTQASATFYWSSDSGSTWNSVAASGSTQSVTLAANTLPAGTIQWKVTATDSQGTTTTSPVYTISTEAALVYATPVAPSQTVEDGSGVIRLRWNISSADGGAQTGFTIVYKYAAGDAWTTLTTQTSANPYYDVPAGTFTAGTVFWGVNPKNIDGTASSGNPSAQFICVAAPGAPTVSCDGKPFATIEWQADGQQAWRLTVDGTVYGPFFGTGKSFTLPDFLADGPHEASVEVQGSYGLWSQAGTVSFTVANVPGDAVTLSAVFGRDAALSWETDSTTADFLIYRDGVRIGHTAKTAFTDRVVLGRHSWQVVNRLAGGYYTASNALTGTLRSCVTAIAALAGGDWTELRLSENSDSVQSFSWSRASSLRHVAGAVYPVLELGPFEDRSGTYDVSFPDAESAREFEALKGRAVILKSRGGEVVIGGLVNLTKVARDFFISYSFTVQRIHREDYIDDT